MRMMKWVQARLLRESMTLVDSTSKSKVLRPGGVEVGGLITDQGAEYERTELTVSGGLLWMLRVYCVLATPVPIKNNLRVIGR